ncbi:hypothetical protein AHF37_01533 [Paragonimus kellicotti]|nr:hypothetical protein AHF37_01533 [Paragonimus kellicotti]
MFEWSYTGVNVSIPGAGGTDCINYASSSQRFYETIIVSGVFSYLARWAWPKISLPFVPSSDDKPGGYKQILLILHCIVFGMELGFKCASSSLIWALNPCHVLTVIQIFLLSFPPCPLVTHLFRLQMHMLNGPLLAIAFPVLNTRLLPFECGVYFIQHLLLLLVPVILVDQTTVYSVEPFDDLSWVVLSLSLQVLYHFLILQPIALVTGINLNNILCPAISDPFEGPHYRMAAMVHQPFLILILGKSITYFGLTWNAQLWWWQSTFLVSQSQPSQKPSASTGGDLLDTWLKPEPEAKEIILNATPWCWTDLFRYQTYMVSGQTDRVCPLHKSSPVDKPTTVVD